MYNKEKDYFDKVRPKPKFFIGDKVTATYKDKRIKGTVLNDSYRSDEEGPVVSIWVEDAIESRNVILVDQKLVKKVKDDS